MEFKLFSGKDAEKATMIAKKARLYVSGWSLRDFLVLLDYETDKSAQVALAYDGEKPIAVVVSFCDETQAFVRKSYRRKGLASSLIKSTGIKILNTSIGIKGSDKFWSKVKCK